MNAATTFRFSGATSGTSCTLTLFLRQDGTGSRAGHLAWGRDVDRRDRADAHHHSQRG